MSTRIEILVQSLPEMRSNYVRKSPTRVEFCVCRNWVSIWSEICIQRRVLLKYRIQHNLTRSAKAWPPRHLCYRPAVFFRLLRFIPLSFTRGKIRRAFKKISLFFIFFNLRNLKLRKSGHVCICQHSSSILSAFCSMDTGFLSRGKAATARACCWPLNSV
jgi:hypothetical protein